MRPSRAGPRAAPGARWRPSLTVFDAARSAAVLTISRCAVGSTSARRASISSSLTMRRPFSSMCTAAISAASAVAVATPPPLPRPSRSSDRPRAPSRQRVPRRGSARGCSRRAGGVAGSPGRTAGRAPAPTRATARDSAAGSVRSAYASSAPDAWARAQARRPRGAAARNVETASWAVLDVLGRGGRVEPEPGQELALQLLRAPGSHGLPERSSRGPRRSRPPGACSSSVHLGLPSLIGRVLTRSVTPAPKCRVTGVVIPSAGRHKCAAGRMLKRYGRS